MLLASMACLASVQIQPGLILDQGGNTYTIQYTNERFSARDTFLVGENGEFKFSYVQLSPDYYDYVGDECAPMYPSLIEELPYSIYADYSYPSGVHVIQIFDQEGNVIEVTKVVR